MDLGALALAREGEDELGVVAGGGFDGGVD